MSLKYNYELHNKVTAFIDYENSLLDEQQYDQWLTLWLDEGMYIVPIDLSNDDYINQLNFAYDNGAMRRMRVARLMSGESISASTSGGTVRLSSRLVIEPVADGSEGNEDDGVINASCGLLINESRLGDNRQFIANVDFQLVPDGDTFMMKQKIVKLINAEHYLRSISYLL